MEKTRDLCLDNLEPPIGMSRMAAWLSMSEWVASPVDPKFTFSCSSGQQHLRCFDQRNSCSPESTNHSPSHPLQKIKSAVHKRGNRANHRKRCGMTQLQLRRQATTSPTPTMQVTAQHAQDFTPSQMALRHLHNCTYRFRLSLIESRVVTIPSAASQVCPKSPSRVASSVLHNPFEDSVVSLEILNCLV